MLLKILRLISHIQSNLYFSLHEPLWCWMQTFHLCLFIIFRKIKRDPTNEYRDSGCSNHLRIILLVDKYRDCLADITTDDYGDNERNERQNICEKRGYPYCSVYFVYSASFNYSVNIGYVKHPRFVCDKLGGRALKIVGYNGIYPRSLLRTRQPCNELPPAPNINGYLPLMFSIRASMQCFIFYCEKN